MFVDVRLLGPLRVFDRSGPFIEIPDELPKALPAFVEGASIVARLAEDVAALEARCTPPTAKGYGTLLLNALHQKV